MTVEQAAYRVKQLGVPTDWGGTGAVLITPDTRDWQLAHAPGVPEQIAAGPPPSRILREWVKGTYDQGQEPSCVAFSTCGLMSTNNQREQGKWLVYDGHLLYRQLGGDGAHGVDPRSALQWARDKGLSPYLSRIASYAFAPTEPEAYLLTVKAAIAANWPVTLAMLLPVDFGRGSAGPLTQSYHQVYIAGYDDARGAFLIKNSWGAWWGEEGFEWVPYATVTRNRMQMGWTFSYTVIDATDGVMPDPVPTPGPVKITGYQAVVPCSLANVNKDFIVTGTGLDAVQSVSIWTLPGAIKSRQPNALFVSFPARIAGPLKLRTATLEVEGPWVDVIG